MPSWLGTVAERRRFASALAFISAEAAGFALGGASTLALWAAGAAVLCALAAFGWDSRAMRRMAAVFLALALAGASQSVEERMLPRGGDGLAKLELEVEQPLGARRGKRGGMSASFLSSHGPVRLKVVMPVEREEDAPRAGEKWLCEGRISEIDGERRSRHGRRIMWCRKGASRRIAQTTRSGFYRRLSERMSASLETGLEGYGDLAAISKGVLLGDKSAITQEDLSKFKSAGTAHILAVSGLHVMFAVTILSWFLKLLKVPERVCAVLSLAPVAAYILLTGSRASALRAGVMAAVFLGSVIFKRPGGSLSCWSTAAIILYALNPHWILDPGATLSFSVMLGIIVWLRAMRGTKPPFSAFFERHSRLRRTATLYWIGFAAWAAGTPICAAYFGTITPAGILAGPIAVTLAGLEISFAAAAAVLGEIWRPLAIAGSVPAAAIAFAARTVSAVAAKIPYGHIKVEEWGIASTAAWYAGLAAFILLARRISMPRKTVPQRPPSYM